MLDLEELEKLCEVTTPGPWEVEGLPDPNDENWQKIDKIGPNYRVLYCPYCGIKLVGSKE